jgi:phosphatidylcholine synthase
MIAAWLVHLYTASGIVLALLAADAAIDGDYRTAFLFLWAQVVIDATDGMLARAANVSSRLPWFSGSKLDDLVDYATYVFVPALCVARGQLVPAGWAVPAASAMLLSSAFGFSRLDAKTPDHFFTGFPSYWNVVVFYLLVAGWSGSANLVVLLGLAALVFVPLRYVYPSRTPVARRPTNLLGAIWAAQVLVMLWQYPTVSPAAFWASLVFPVYYFVLSAVVHMRARQR